MARKEHAVGTSYWVAVHRTAEYERRSVADVRSDPQFRADWQNLRDIWAYERAQREIDKREASGQLTPERAEARRDLLSREYPAVANVQADRRPEGRYAKILERTWLRPHGSPYMVGDTPRAKKK